MKTYSQKSEPFSRNQERTSKAANQAPASVVLQNYKENFITQRKEEPNKTGMPDELKSRIENLSGYSMDDVKVHYNSDKPTQLQALAYTQGSNIYVGPGQEKQLPHEAWHVIQQKQGRVQPSMQLKGVQVNDDDGLEREADVMGNSFNRKIIQRKAKVIIDDQGLSIKRNNDLKYIDNSLPELGSIYRHMSPKDSRLKLAESFFKTLHGENPTFEESRKALIILQNQLTGYEFFTEHLGSQFMGTAEENRKLTHGEYDSILLAAEERGEPLTVYLIDKELNALAEHYMYKLLSIQGPNAIKFMESVQSTSQLTLPAMWLFDLSIKSQMRITAKKLGVNEDSVIELMKDRINPIMLQKAMGAIAFAAQKAFIERKWIGPRNQDNSPSLLYYNKEDDITGYS